MLDNYSELLNRSLGGEVHPDFPDECLFAEADDPARFKAVLKKIKAAIKSGNTDSKRFQDYLDSYKSYKSNENWSDPEIDSYLRKKNQTSYDRHHAKVETAGAVAGAVGGGYVGHKLGRALEKKVKSNRGKKLIHAASTITGAGLGGYAGYKAGKGYSKAYLNRSKSNPLTEALRRKHQKELVKQDLKLVGSMGMAGASAGLNIASHDINYKRMKGKKITKKDWKRVGKFSAVGALAGLAVGSATPGLVYNHLVK